MKDETTLKSFAELSPEILEMKTAKPAQASPKQIRSGEEQQKTALPVVVPEFSDSGGYRHWGLND